ncbi:hypothetical protein GGX14DRAFT_408369 [Mycena pura]|uniref:Uncharacterized protein n=1 Tax=Mycena pura TaxID=153505 RepID=A0AAD6UN00_9AGAR|nr:hypothetical protein GGX14DRAFT_408369 [Mycena pura]
MHVIHHLFPCHVERRVQSRVNAGGILRLIRASFMDPLEDAYDRLLRDEVVSDELLSAAQALEEAAMLSPSAPVQVADADEYDLMFTEDVSEDVLLAWDEAGREAWALPAKSGVGETDTIVAAAAHPRKLDATHPSGPSRLLGHDAPSRINHAFFPNISRQRVTTCNAVFKSTSRIPEWNTTSSFDCTFVASTSLERITASQ